jgi:hypothetical protein
MELMVRRGTQAEIRRERVCASAETYKLLVGNRLSEDDKRNVDMRALEEV